MSLLLLFRRHGLRVAPPTLGIGRPGVGLPARHSADAPARMAISGPARAAGAGRGRRNTQGRTR